MVRWSGTKQKDYPTRSWYNSIPSFLDQTQKRCLKRALYQAHCTVRRSNAPRSRINADIFRFYPFLYVTLWSVDFPCVGVASTDSRRLPNMVGWMDLAGFRIDGWLILLVVLVCSFEQGCFILMVSLSFERKYFICEWIWKMSCAMIVRLLMIVIVAVLCFSLRKGLENLF